MSFRNVAIASVASVVAATTGTLATVDPEYYCPKGYTTNGDQCVAVLNVEPTPSCASGYTLTNNSACTKTVTASFEISCPDDMSLSNDGKSCTKTQLVQPNIYCPTGYAEEGNVCTKTVTSSFRSQTTVTTQNADVSYTCAAGYTLNSDNTCTRDITVAKLVSTSTGVETGNVLTSCSKGFTMEVSDSGNKVCTKLNTINMSARTEYDTDSADLVYNCPTGYNVVDNQCVREITTARLSKTNVVVENADFEPTCDSGDYDKTSNSCVTITAASMATKTQYVDEDADKLRSCKTGFTMSADASKCEKLQNVAKKASTDYTEKTTAFNPTCPAKTVLDAKNQTCAKTETAKRISKVTKDVQTEASFLSCPTGYDVQQDGTCIRTVTAAMTTKNTDVTSVCDVDYNCPAGYTASKEDAFVCEKESLQVPVSSVQSTTELCQLTKVCANGYVLQEDGSCAYQTTANYITTCNDSVDAKGAVVRSCQQFCPKGFTDSGKVCVALVKSQPVDACPTACDYNKVTKKCTTTSTFVESYCPKGTTEGKDGQCVSILTAQPESVCPSDCKSVKTGSLKSSPTVCQKTETVTETYCPKGYTEGADGTCVATVIIPGNPTCKAGFTLSADKKTCSQTNTLTTLVCPEGFTESSASSVCEKVTVTPASLVCPAGFAVNAAGVCATKVPQTSFFCPEGSELNTADDKCYTTLSTAVTETCPKNTKTDKSGRCIASVAVSVAACPSGFSDSGKGCSKISSVAPTMVCPTGFTATKATKQQPSVCTKSTSETETYCAKGFTDNGNGCVTVNTASMIGSCPEGYTLAVSKDVCVKQVPRTVNYCAKGYTEGADGKCVSTTYSPVVESCGEGYTYSNGACTKQVTYQSLYCAKGFTENGNGCVNTVTSAPTPVCPADYTLSADKKTCTTAVDVTTFYCPKGFTDNGVDCSSVNAVEKITSCPPGTQKVSAQTCSTTSTSAPTSSCPAGYTPSGSKKTCESKEALTATFSCSTADCTETFYANWLVKCPSGFSLTNGKCVGPAEKKRL